MNYFGAVQGILRLGDCHLPAFALLAWRPLPFLVRDHGASARVRTRVPPSAPPPCRQAAMTRLLFVGFRPAGNFRRLVGVAQIGGQVGMLAERSIGSEPENDARFRHGRGDDVRIVALLRRALVEEVTVGAPTPP